MSQIQLGSLDYDEIKNELKSFLSNQEELRDYNFDGSILSTIVDLMAYNTMYYAFYSNMQANEAFLDTAQRTDSLISLAKPLGYVVPHRKSATSQITLTGVEGSDNVSFGRYELRLTGSDASGTIRTFYNLNPITLSSATVPSATGTFYEANEVVLDAVVNVDLDSQKFDIFDKTVDPIGIIVKVNGVEWRKQEGIDPDLNSLSEVYFVEPSKNGYVVRMGGLTETESGQIIGKGVAPEDVVTVSYFSSNGSLGNNITGIFGNDSVSIQTAEATTLSAGGFNSPNPDVIKFFAPRFFATQNRAVTAEDFKTIGASLLGLESNASFINVFGHEDIGNLPHLNYTNEDGANITDQEFFSGSPGEVYVSYLNSSGEAPSSSEQSIFFNQLKTKSVAGLSLLYYPPRVGELVVKIQNPSEQEINTFNTLFPDGFTDVNSELFANSGGRAFSTATITFTDNPNNASGGKFFFKNKMDRNVPFVMTPETFIPRPDELDTTGVWYDLSSITIDEPSSGNDGYFSPIFAADAEQYITQAGAWFTASKQIGAIYWDTGEIQILSLQQSPVDYGNITFSANVDFNAANQNQTIYAPHNFYLSSKLENTS
tara:strand:- start:53596 stop:55392 length:1797 start_codon:yes stop_codon:yes gene_type:complete